MKNFKRILAVLFIVIASWDLYLILFTPLSAYTLFLVLFTGYFTYRARQLWQESNNEEK